MGDRLGLHELLTVILGTSNVYFQAPSTPSMKYPCIVYERNYTTVKTANDKPYIYRKRYKLTVIENDPDSLIPDKVATLPLCSFDRHYTVNNLIHDVYNIYY